MSFVIQPRPPITCLFYARRPAETWPAREGLPAARALRPSRPPRPARRARSSQRAQGVRSSSNLYHSSPFCRRYLRRREGAAQLTRSSAWRLGGERESASPTPRPAQRAGRKRAQRAARAKDEAQQTTELTARQQLQRRAPLGRGWPGCSAGAGAAAADQLNSLETELQVRGTTTGDLDHSMFSKRVL